MSRGKKRIEHDQIVQLFAGRLRAVRRERGLTQVDLAKQAQVTVGYISRLEKAGAAPGVDLVARIAAALGVAVTDLLPAAVQPDDLMVLRDQVIVTLSTAFRTAPISTCFLDRLPG